MYEQFLQGPCSRPWGSTTCGRGSVSGAAVYALGRRTWDAVWEHLETTEREGPDRHGGGRGAWDRAEEALFARRPAASTAEDRRAAIAALLQIDGDSLTPSAIDATLRGCGIKARALEMGDGQLRVIFPEVAGEPEGFDQIRRIILDILPCHLGGGVLLPVPDLGGVRAGRLHLGAGGGGGTHLGEFSAGGAAGGLRPGGEKVLEFSRAFLYNKPVSICRCDGIGRRDGLKIRWWRHRVGSSPTTGTSSSQALYRLRRAFSFHCKAHRALILRLLASKPQPAATRSAAVGGFAALRMRPAPCGYCAGLRFGSAAARRHFFDTEKISILTAPSKKKDICFQQMSFFLGSAAKRAAPPFGISMLGRNEFALRNSPPPIAAPNLRRKSAAAQKGRWMVLLLTVPKLKISLLTAPPGRRGGRSGGGCTQTCNLSAPRPHG